VNFILKWIFNITLVICSVVSSDVAIHGGSDVKTFRTEQFFSKQTTQAIEKTRLHVLQTDSFSQLWRISLVDHNTRVRIKEKSLILDEKVFVAILSDPKFTHRPRPAKEPVARTVS
jgi:hypothetical protein